MGALLFLLLGATSCEEAIKQYNQAKQTRVMVEWYINSKRERRNLDGEVIRPATPSPPPEEEKAFTKVLAAELSAREARDAACNTSK